MSLKIEQVTDLTEQDLVIYAGQYGPEHDGSYLPGRDFQISADHPSYLLWQDNQLVGAVGLMRTKRFLSINKGRFSIFHSILNTREAYLKLLHAIEPHFQDLQSVYLFIPEEKAEMAAFLSGLNFQIERYSFILERKEKELYEVEFPDNFAVQQLTPADKVGISQFAACINQEFKELAGHTPSTPEDIQTWFDAPGFLEGGLCLLKKGQEPVGTISMMKDLENLEAGEIAAFGILNIFRGQNLGRNLFRYGVNFLIGEGLNPITLSVNGENHTAFHLYEFEGFALTESVVCYALDCS